MSTGPHRRHLVILAKEPRPGRVKTRLAQTVGPVAAARWYRRTLDGLLRRLAHDPRWRCVLAVAPDASRMSPVWPPDVARIPQGRGDLGDRMRRALAARPPGPAVLIGADIPGVAPHHIARAFSLLGRHDAVLGPAEDGGYWLVGLRRGGQATPAGIFRGVRWSGPHALADTVASLAPLRVGMADRLADVDTAEDLARLQSTCAIRSLSAPL